MPIFEYACPKCRVVFDFLCRQTTKPKRSPKCPRCGNKKMTQEVSRFAISRGGASSKLGDAGGESADGPMPDLDDPKIERAMMQMEKEMSSLDENDPRQLAHMMKKMKDIMPPGAMPKEFDVAIRRLEAGEDPEKIEEDMGDLLGDVPGGHRGGGGYSHDEGLYDY